MVYNNLTSPCVTADDVLEIFKKYHNESMTVRHITSLIYNISEDLIDLNACSIIYAKIRNLRKSRLVQVECQATYKGKNVLKYKLRT